VLTEEATVIEARAFAVAMVLHRHVMARAANRPPAHLQRSARGVAMTVAIAVLFVTAILVATPTSMDMAM
jgi:hypothetical protein